ncbi:CpaF family protein [Paeniglutamicibacter terrestris]|jgi:pilus assembly protein CpaF|uniref:CpaF family protein n=1 Tax=Paeniglutamicibacter terrestris TaxID=2723403 RepID=A0ABX1G7C4_9MICC|nr:ATPase, T2SS/T4P/T4SS family [Paeniglutamicibacter terrestris]NKG22173.1 CpaF family protein [Paeniglutamicibacter terrestris]
MSEGLAIVEDEVRELIRRRGLDPATQIAEVRRLIDDVVGEYDQRSLLGVLPALGDLSLARRRVMDTVAGLGALQPLLDDDEVEEIWLNSPHEVYAARGGTSELTSVRLSEAEIPALVERMLKSSGRRLDLSQPFVDCQLVDGSRLHVVIPDITRKHWAVNIRKFIARASRLEHLVELGSLSRQAAHYLDVAVGAGLNVLVSGATQSGKTTMLNCLASSIGSRERVVTIEEIFELQINLRDVVGMQTRQQNLEGTGEISMRKLVKEALRMRPDRLVIGEVREAEALDMLIALNSGLPGLSTIHANSAHDAVTKICTLPLLAGENISAAFVVPTVAACIDLVVHCRRDATGRRFVGQIMALGRRVENGAIETTILFDQSDGTLRLQPAADLAHQKLIDAGIDIAELGRLVA